MNPRARIAFLGSSVALVSVCTAVLLHAGDTKEHSANVKPDTLRILAAGPGRVEPISEEIKLGSELNGRLAEVRVEEGAAITRDQILAVLENEEYAAAVRSAEAQVRVKEAALRKLLTGPRAQERSAAVAATHEADAVLRNVRLELERRRKLFAENVISKEELESYARAEEVARAQRQQARQRQSLVEDPAREEDRAMAEAELELARSRLEEARARYEKTFIRSPITGSVLRKHHRQGESVSSSSTLPDTILTVGDKQTLRVRVEIDESDVRRLRTGQQVYVSADAFGARKFWGSIIRIGEQLGRKNIRTSDPTERLDNNVLEALVELDRGASLPIGLRVDAFILEGARPKDTASSQSVAEAPAR